VLALAPRTSETVWSSTCRHPASLSRE